MPYFNPYVTYDPILGLQANGVAIGISAGGGALTPVQSAATPRVRHVLPRSEFDAAIVAERALIAAGGATNWVTGEELQPIGETGTRRWTAATGGSAAANAAASNARTVSLVGGIAVLTLGLDACTVTTVATPGVAPVTASTNVGDVQVDYSIFAYYVMGATVWGPAVYFLAPIGGYRVITASGPILPSDNGKTLINAGSTNFNLTVNSGLGPAFGVAAVGLAAGTLTFVQGTATLNTTVGGAANPGAMLPLFLQQSGTDTYFTVGAAAGNAAGYVAGAATASIAYAVPSTTFDLSKELNTKEGLLADYAITAYANTPTVANTWLNWRFSNADTVSHALTFPATPPVFSLRQNANITSLPIAAGAVVALDLLYDLANSRFLLINDPTIPSAALVLYQGSWAGRPTSGLTNGTYYEAVFTSGLGAASRYVKHFTIDAGATWRPVGGKLILAQRTGSVAAPLSSITGVTAGSFTLPEVPVIPAGYLATHARVKIDLTVRKTSSGTGSSYSLGVRLGTAGNTTDQLFFGPVVGAAGVLHDYYGSGEADIFSTTGYTIRNAQVPNGSANSAGSFTDRNGGTVNTAAAMTVSADISAGATTDTYALISYCVWVEQ